MRDLEKLREDREKLRTDPSYVVPEFGKNTEGVSSRMCRKGLYICAEPAFHEANDLLRRMLEPDFKNRITADEGLKCVVSETVQ